MYAIFVKNKPESFQPSKASQTFQYFEKKDRLAFSSQKVTSKLTQVFLDKKQYL